MAWKLWAGKGAILALAAAGTALVLDHQRLDSATMDEPFHALASAEYVMRGTYFANLEHPPLAKLLSGLALEAAGARPPRFGEPFEMKTAEQPFPWSYGNTISSGRLFAAARSPFPVLFFVLVVSCAALAWRLAGPLAGVAAAALAAFEPTAVAHAAYLHTDVPASLAFLAVTAVSLHAAASPSLARFALAGAALGLALATKFTAVILVPLVVVAALHGVLRRGALREKWRRPAAHLLVAGGAALAVLLLVYGIAMRRMTADDADAAVRIFLTQRTASPETIEKVSRLSRVVPGLAHYGAGLLGIALQNRTGGGVNVLHGHLSVDGFPSYFFVAFLVKSALGFLCLLLAALAVSAVTRTAPSRDVAFLLLPVVLVFLSSLRTSYNIGVRHVLPAYPLLLAAAVVILVRILSARTAALVLSAAALLQAGETLSVHPHEISFFNALAGGSSNGARWLNDSNLDWGQDLLRLARDLERRGAEKETAIAYFGGGNPMEACPKSHLFDPARPDLSPGVYAVSSYLLAAGPESMAARGDVRRAAGYALLRNALLSRGRLIGRVGYSIFLYRLPRGTNAS